MIRGIPIFGDFPRETSAVAVYSLGGSPFPDRPSVFPQHKLNVELHPCHATLEDTTEFPRGKKFAAQTENSRPAIAKSLFFGYKTYLQGRGLSAVGLTFP